MSDLRRPTVLLLGQYPLDNLNSAPKVRTYAIWKSLSEISDVTFITGSRSERRMDLLKFVFLLKLRKIQVIYLEAATSTSMETDILILGLAKILRIPIGIFVRDAHPLFGMIDTRSLKNKILVLGWYISLWFYKKLANHIYYPSRSFAALFPDTSDKQVILPPGGRQAPFIALPRQDRYIFYSGGIKGIYGGLDKALEAVQNLIAEYGDLKFLCVCRPDERQYLSRWENKSWLEVKHISTDEILAYQSQIYLGVICLEQVPYSEIALPVKLFDYLALGKPVLATPCFEMQTFIEQHQVGKIVENSAETFQYEIKYLLDNYDVAQSMAERAHRLIQDAHTWHHRAQTILDTLLAKS